MTPARIKEAAMKARHRSSSNVRNLRKRHKRAAMLALLATKEFSAEEEILNNALNLEDILRAAEPLAKGEFGENSMQHAVFINSLSMLGKGTKKRRWKGARYSDEVITFALFLLQRCDAASYEQISRVFHLPTRRHMQQIKANEFEDSGDGPCDKMMRKAREELQEAGLADDQHSCDVILAFDSMKMRRCMMLSTKKGDEGSIIGVVLPETYGIARKEFNDYVTRLSAAVDQDEQANFVDKSTQTSTANKVADQLNENTEHTVFYATSLDPNCKVSFLCAKYNNPSIHGTTVLTQVTEVSERLAEFCFNVRIIVSDSAASNQSFAAAAATIPASSLIPKSVLDGGPNQRSLDGDFNIAFERPWENGKKGAEPVFIVDDPPHVIKRVAAQMENKDLRWGLEVSNESVMPMAMGVLEDIYNSVSRSSLQLREARKLTAGHFRGNSFSKMRVGRAAQVLSRTMAKLIRRVGGGTSENYPLITVAPEQVKDGEHRRRFLSKVLELVERMDRFFDICNSKDNLESGYRHENRIIDDSNGVAYAAELLDTLRWIYEWKDSITDSDGVVKWEHFLTKETFKSMQYVCYSFAALIYQVPLVSTRGIVLKRINQDIVEHHFGHTRAGAGSTDAPTEFQCDKADQISQVIRYVKGVMIRGNVSKGELDSDVSDSDVSEGGLDSDMDEDVDLKRKSKQSRDSPCAERASKKSKGDEDEDSTSHSEMDLPRQELFKEEN